MSNLIERQAAIDALCSDCKGRCIPCDSYPCSDVEVINALPSVQPEITDEQAIAHLHSSGWMQQHDKEMHESGLRERLADDSGSYDSLIPCEDTTVCTTADTTDTTADTTDTTADTTDRQVTGKVEPCKDALDDAYAHGYTEAEAKFYQWREEHECEDAVSRKDVVDLYKRGAERIAKVKGMSVEELPHRGLDVLMNLPSVMPVRDCKGCRFKFLPERKEDETG